MNWLSQSILCHMPVFFYFSLCCTVIDEHGNSCRQWHTKSLYNFTVGLLPSRYFSLDAFVYKSSVFFIFAESSTRSNTKIMLIFFFLKSISLSLLHGDFSNWSVAHLIFRGTLWIYSFWKISEFFVNNVLIPNVTWESSHKWEWYAVVKSAVAQIAKKKNMELLTFLSNTITSEFGFQKYYLLFSPLVGSYWNK